MRESRLELCNVGIHQLSGRGGTRSDRSGFIKSGSLVFSWRPAVHVSIQVPESDASDLVRLASELGFPDTVPSSVHPFDGSVLVQIAVPFSLATAAVLRTWISARQAARKSMHIMADGIDLTGYTATEAIRLIESMTEDSTIASSDAE